MTSPVRIGIAGLGTVGVSVVRNLLEHELRLGQQAGRPVVLSAVSARSRDKDRGVELSGLQWFDDPIKLAQFEGIDLFVELIGGEDDPAYAAVKTALAAGKSVVTANKALLAHHGVELAGLAEQNSAALGFEAAVAGGIPIIKTLREALSGNSIQWVSGILNGTCNYILTRMEREGLSFDECLTEAQRLGYAEADPTFDVDGFDTAHKLAILSCLAFGTEISIDKMHIEGIRAVTLDDIHAAGELGYRIKLLGVAERTETGIEQRVHPTLVPNDSPLGKTTGVLNAVALTADYVGGINLEGPGAGGDATASAVIGDIIDLARGSRVYPLRIPADDLAPFVQARMRRHEGGYYVRLTIEDRPGAFAAIATKMADADISLASIVQRGPGPNAVTPESDTQVVVIVTHETTEASMRLALEAVVEEGRVVGAPQMIRIEKVS